MSEEKEITSNFDINTPEHLKNAPKDSDAAQQTIKNPKKGAFLRSATAYHNHVEDNAEAKYPVESGRYHLYASHACPWANRCTAMRSIMGLEEHIALSVVEPTVKDMMIKETYLGWGFGDSYGETPEPHGFKTVSELYELATPGFRQSYLDEKARPYYSVPILWDTKTNSIVSNESAHIVRMFNGPFRKLHKPDTPDLYPEHLREAIDAVNVWVYPDINDGVYRCGFAGSQEAYNDAYDALFAALDKVEEILTTTRYIAGGQFTEADVRLFMTLVRFDPVYVRHFMTNKKRISDYECISKYVAEIYQMPAIKKVIHIDHIKTHYFTSHPKLNPLALIPNGPDLSFMDAEHGRDKQFYFND